MKKFEYKIKDEIGIHARPAGLLVKEAKKYESKIRLMKGDRSAEATGLMAVLGLGIKCGETITVEIEGKDEERSYKELKEFFETNL